MRLVYVGPARDPVEVAGINVEYGVPFECDTELATRLLEGGQFEKSKGPTPAAGAAATERGEE